MPWRENQQLGLQEYVIVRTVGAEPKKQVKDEVYLGRVVWVVGGNVNVEYEDASFVRRV